MKSAAPDLVQYYENPSLLIKKVSVFILAGLEQGEGAILIATTDHLDAFAQCFELGGMDVSSLKSKGQLRMIEVNAALETVMVHGRPDPIRFKLEIGEMIETMRKIYPSIRVYGEMVNHLINASQAEAALELEQLWNEHTTGMSTDIYRVSLLEPQAEATVMERLQRSEAFKKAILNSSRDCIKVLNLEGQLVYMNEGGLQVTEVCDFKHVAGLCWFDFWGPDLKPRAIEAFNRAKAGGMGEITAQAPTARTKTLKWWHTVLSPILNEMGMVEGILAVSRDISESKRLEMDLRGAVEARDELMSICSHELKTPLCSLRLLTEIAKKRIEKDSPNAYEPEAVKKLVSDYEQQVERLIKLVEEMLDLTQIRSGRLNLAIEEVRLSQLVYEVLERFSDHLNAAGCEITVKVAPGIIGRWDRFRIEQVLINLLTNAIRYGEKKPIEIRLTRFGERVQLSVQDHGMGIAKENHERIFKRFERAVSPSDASGLGLGLYIVTEIVKGHSGSITVHSELGQGATFTVELPLNPAF